MEILIFPLNIFPSAPDDVRLARVSGVSEGKRGRMEAKKGESGRRETPDTDAFTGAFHPHTA